VALFFVTARYRAPLVPILLLLAAFAAVELARRALRPARGLAARARALGPPLAAVAALAVVVHLDLVRIDRAAAYIGLGIALAAEGRDPEAIAAFRSAVAAAPGDPVAQINLAAAHLKAGDPASARDAFRAAVALAPRSAVGWSGLAESHARLGEPREAAAALRRAIGLSTGEPSLWARLAVAERAAGRLDSARAAIARAQELDPRNDAIRELGAELRGPGPS
jgi:Flp pilus assembly protein TadD